MMWAAAHIQSHALRRLVAAIDTGRQQTNKRPASTNLELEATSYFLFTNTHGQFADDRMTWFVTCQINEMFRTLVSRAVRQFGQSSTTSVLARRTTTTRVSAPASASVVAIARVTVRPPVRGLSTAGGAGSGGGGGGGGGKSGSSVGTSFINDSMSDSERERILRAMKLYEDASKFVEAGTTGSRAEGAKLFAEAVTADPNGPIGFRSLLALAAINTGSNAARVIEHTTQALQLLQNATARDQREMLQLPEADANEKRLHSAVADFVWGLRLNIGFQTIDWMVNKRVQPNTPELGFLLVLLKEHFAPSRIFDSTRTDPQALEMMERARKALLAVSEYLKVVRLYTEAESFAKSALDGVPANSTAGWVAEGWFQIAAIRTSAGAAPDTVLPFAHKALIANPNHWKSHALIGEVALFSSDFASAISHLDKALSAPPAVEFIGSTHFSMANALFHKAMSIERVAVSSPESIAASAASGSGPTASEHAALKGEYETLLDDAISHYRSALTEPAKSRLIPQVLNGVNANLGAALLKRNRPEEAMKLLSAGASAINEKVSLPRLNLVFALLAQGPYERGRSYHLHRGWCIRPGATRFILCCVFVLLMVCAAEPEIESFLGVTRLASGEVEDVDSKLVEAALTEGAKRLAGQPEHALKYFEGALKIMNATKSYAHHPHIIRTRIN